MLSERQIVILKKTYDLLPQITAEKAAAVICLQCSYANETEFSFCTNCGYPLQNKLLVDAFNKRVQHRTNLLFKAQSAVMIARVVLYMMAAFLSLGIFFVFAENSRKYIVVMLALVFSGLFFFLALWSRKNPFTALLTAFIILIAFSAANIFGSLVQSFTTVSGITGMFICIALLLVVLKGVQGAYRISLIKEELEPGI